MNDFFTHGRILGGVVATPDLEAALDDYQGRLGLVQSDAGTVSQALASSWGCTSLAGARTVTLSPASGTPCHLRLVEQPLPSSFYPTRTFGWAAYEITVQDIFSWPAKLAGSGFKIVGEPKEIPGLPYFVAMQMLGRGREMIYLNEVRANTPTSDLPPAQSAVDHLFIVILATPDRARTMAWYNEHLGLAEGGSYTIPYTMISRAFDLPIDTLHSLSMAQVGRMPVIEIDDYPDAATARPAPAGMLPPGNALITLGIERMQDRNLDFIAPPTAHPAPFYGGRRSATVRGPAGELLELVEI